MVYNYNFIKNNNIPLYNETSKNGITIPFDINQNTSYETINETEFSNESSNNYDNNFSNTIDSDDSNEENFFKEFSQLFGSRSERNRINIFGFSLRTDTITIIAVILFLLFEKTPDIVLIIGLGLLLFNLSLNFLQ